MVLETPIRDAMAKLDPAFAYADRFDAETGEYDGLRFAKAAPEIFPASAVLVRGDVAKEHLPGPTPSATVGGLNVASGAVQSMEVREELQPVAQPTPPAKPRRFFGSVEIDMTRPVKSFDTILNAVVMELQRTHGAKVKLTLEIEAEAASGFDDAEVSVVRDNAKQLKFNAGSTGFED